LRSHPPLCKRHNGVSQAAPEVCEGEVYRTPVRYVRPRANLGVPGTVLRLLAR